MQAPPDTENPINADDASEVGDVHEASSLASLRSSIMENQVENGRTYHSLSAGKYSYPNDDRESERYDLQHHVWLVCLDGELALNPGHRTAKRVLDLGTGTGVWAIDYADAFPAAEVIGVDLSPIQPEWTPTNCFFEVDDLEKEWLWKTPFDFIMCRGMAGAFANVPAIIQKVYDNLTPGGWYEVGDLALPLGCDDDTVSKDSALWKWHDAVYQASKQMGRPIDSLSVHMDTMKATGFVDVKLHEFKWPLNPWPKDPHLKILGDWQFHNLSMGLEAISLALLTRVMGWTKEEVFALCALARKELRSLKIHAYWRIQCVYARKPETGEDEQ
ncbi:Secondary metabolism regulator LAE1 [Colletotrichum siamense]|nr:Secondary metabolism regulator LAE1 [Colletotrichum siamense]